MRRIGTVVVLIGLAACSSGRSAPAKAKSAGTTTTTTTSRPLDPTEARADRVARAGLVRGDDLPTEYRTGPAAKPDDAAIRATPACASFGSLTDHGEANAFSPTFFTNTALVSNDVSVFPSETATHSVVAAYQDPAIIRCWHDLVAASFGKQSGGVALTSLDVSPLALDAVGDEIVGFRFTAAMTTTAGAPTTSLQDQIVVRVGRAAMSLRAVAKDSATLAQVESTLLPKLVTRLRAAIAEESKG